jgi:ABC-type sugar transport system substrate-binding protein
VAVALLNRVPPWVHEVRAACPEGLLVGVAPRQEGIGEIQARQALRIVRTGAFAILITGDASVASERRKNGFMAEVGDRLRVHILEGSWAASGAEQALSEWFRIGAERERAPDIVVCQNDAMALGARKALAHQATSSGRAELASVPLLGCDGLPQEGRAMLERGEIRGTVVVAASTPPALEALRGYWQTGARVDMVEFEAAPLPPL